MRYTLLFPLMLTACATFPALEGTISEAAQQAPYPDLAPLPAFPPENAGDDAAMQARIDALQARAARIRQIDIATLQ